MGFTIKAAKKLCFGYQCQRKQTEVRFFLKVKAIDVARCIGELSVAWQAVKTRGLAYGFLKDASRIATCSAFRSIVGQNNDIP